MFAEDINNLHPQILKWYSYIGIDMPLFYQNYRRFVYSREKYAAPLGEWTYHSTRWIHFENNSLLIYCKGNHSVLTQIMEDFYPGIQQSGCPDLKTNILIPIVDPVYSFISGVFSSGTHHMFKQRNNVFYDIVAGICGEETVNLLSKEDYFGHLSAAIYHTFPMDTSEDYNKNHSVIFNLISRLVKAVLVKTNTIDNRSIIIDPSHTTPLAIRLASAFTEWNYSSGKFIEHKDLRHNKLSCIDFTKPGVPHTEQFVDKFPLEMRARVNKQLAVRKETHGYRFRDIVNQWTFEDPNTYYKLRTMLKNEYIIQRHLQFENSFSCIFDNQ